ncbi:MAG TPA: DNA replication/repair protein RecF [Firmicutes bacterium]|nr:DNA replication/repair protein RecF [Bacillota bacterium]HBT15622.1 DNA replication/repair protein RecF [Bacillota bacterium]
MYLEKIKIRNFRNYCTADVLLAPHINVLYGNNGQGKTNFLEAVSFLTLGSSFRTKRDEELLKREEKGFYLRGEFLDNDESLLLEVGTDLNRLVVKVNGVVYKSKRALFGRVRTVIFTPDDLQIIKGGPEKRREYLDLYLAQAYSGYRKVFLDFYRALYQRNSLLKKFREGFRDFTELEIWTNKVIEEGSRIIYYRLKAVEEISPWINRYHQLMSKEKEDLHGLYICTGEMRPILDIDCIKEEYKKAISRRKIEEMRRGYTLVGPHRDDLQLLLNQKWDLRVYGSQGQQRTAALALKLAMVDLIKRTQGVPPLLLLDDVFSEFDNERKKELLRLLTAGTQTIISTTELRDFPNLGSEFKALRVESGVIFD